MAVPLLAGSLTFGNASRVPEYVQDSFILNPKESTAIRTAFHNSLTIQPPQELWAISGSRLSSHQPSVEFVLNFIQNPSNAAACTAVIYSTQRSAGRSNENLTQFLGPLVDALLMRVRNGNFGVAPSAIILDILASQPVATVFNRLWVERA